jgi:hypothetical protein
MIVAALVGFHLNFMDASVLAATDVRGPPDDIRLGAQNASIREVLDTLAASYKLIYKLPANVRADLTIQCSGTLRQILERVLDGNDYVLKVSEDGIEVVVLGASGAAAIAAAGPVITVNKNTDASTPSSAKVSGPVQPQAKAPPPLTNYLSQSPAASVIPQP